MKMKKLFFSLLTLIAFNGSAYQWVSRDYTETGSDGNARTARISWPDDFPFVRGILVSITADSRIDYSKPEFTEFLRAHQFAFMGMSGIASTAQVRPLLTNAVPAIAAASGHGELTNAPWVWYGFSAGGSISIGMLTTVVPAIQFLAIADASGAFGVPPGNIFPTTLPAEVFQVPILLCAGQNDPAIAAAMTSLFAANRATGALMSYVTIEGGIHDDLSGQKALLMAHLDRAVRLRYPTNQCVLTQKIIPNVLLESSGWLGETNGYGKAIAMATNYAAMGSPRSQNWFVDETMANLWRGFATWQPAFKITSPAANPVAEFAAGAVIDLQFAMTLPSWSNLSIYNGAAKLADLTSGSSFRLTSSAVAGVYAISAIATAGGVNHPCKPVLFYVRHPAPAFACLDGPVVPPVVIPSPTPLPPSTNFTVTRILNPSISNIFASFSTVDSGSNLTVNLPASGSFAAMIAQGTNNVVFNYSGPGSATVNSNGSISLQLLSAGQLSGKGIVTNASSLYVMFTNAIPNTGPTNSLVVSTSAELAAAIAANSTVKAGGTIYLHGGVYPGRFVAALSGTKTAPITIRSAPGEWAVIDGGAPPGTRSITMTVNGSNVWVRDVEIMSSSTETRFTTDDSSFPTNLFRADGIHFFGAGCKLINSVVHDTMTGVSAWGPAGDFECYGCKIFRCGWKSGHNHGHGFYLQNFLVSGPKHIHHNYIFDNYDRQIQAYGSSEAELAHLWIENNWGSGEITVGGRSGTPVVDIHANGNELENGDLNLRYQSGTNYLDMQAFGNTVGYGALVAGYWKTASLSSNVIVQRIGKSMLATLYQDLPTGPVPPWIWNGNAYYGNKADCFGVDSQGFFTLTTWQMRTGWDKQSTFALNTRPPNKVLVAPNAYDPNLCDVLVRNWTKADVVAVVLSATGWNAGDTLEIRTGQNWSGDVTRTLYAPTMNFDLRAVSHPVGLPLGDGLATPLNLMPEFGVFHLRKL